MPQHYEIRIRGRLGADWSDWFDGFSLLEEKDVTVLRGPVVDQAALFGILARIRDLNLGLISINPAGEKK
jgi:hypothetical protein